MLRLKHKYIGQMYEKLMSKLYSEEEMEVFKNLSRNVVVIMSNNSQALLGEGVRRRQGSAGCMNINQNLQIDLKY